jgi:hypothetical protein
MSANSCLRPLRRFAAPPLRGLREGEEKMLLHAVFSALMASKQTTGMRQGNNP